MTTILEARISENCILLSNENFYNTGLRITTGLRFIVLDEIEAPSATVVYEAAYKNAEGSMIVIPLTAATHKEGKPWVFDAVDFDRNVVPSESALRFYCKITGYETYTTKTLILRRVRSGGGESVIEHIQENGVELPISDKTVNVTVPQADWTQGDTGALDFIKNKPALKRVAETGSYKDLVDVPSIAQADWTETDTQKAAYIKNKPSLATVATSGSYEDLLNKPHIPLDQVQSNWTETDTSKSSYIQNKPQLATVATSGSYDDLSNKPHIPLDQIRSDWAQTIETSADFIKNKPTIGNAVITLKQGEVTKGFFPLNSTTATTITFDAPVQANWSESSTTAPDYIKNKPTSLSQFTDDLGSSPEHTHAQYATTISVAAIEAKIPAAASTTNQLADKAFVNSSIASQTSRFRGTHECETEAEFLAWAQALTEKDPNDYTFWSHAVSGNPVYDRYKYDGTNWNFEYRLNNSSFTAVQWEAINSGATSGKITDYDAHIISTSNPHNVTAAQVGAYTTTQTDTLLGGKAASSHSHAGTDITSGVIGISYIPTIPSTKVTGLHAVATSGSYNDLDNKPTIPAAQIPSDWSQSVTTAPDYIKNKPATFPPSSHTHTAEDVTSGTFSVDLIPSLSAEKITSGTLALDRIPTIPATKTSGFATVATSGSYNDLSDKPGAPNNPAITINHNGTCAGSFTLNQTDSAIISINQLQADWNQSTTTAYDYIKNKPTIPVIPDPWPQANWSTTSQTDPTYIWNKPTIVNPNDSTISIVQGGVTKGSFTLNQSTSGTITIDAPVEQIQADWNEDTTASKAFIKNKPSVPAPANNGEITIIQGTTTKGTFTVDQSTSTTITLDSQVQSDWNQSTTTAVDYIKNKPEVARVVVISIPREYWSDINEWTADISGLGANDYVMVGPDSASTEAVMSCTTYCKAQGAGTLTFKTEEIPSGTVTFHAWIIKHS